MMFKTLRRPSISNVCSNFFLHCNKIVVTTNIRAISYVQGQSPMPNTREYFYYVDHQGMLFLDDARIKNFTSCFKEKKFLHFFFTRLKQNDTGKYKKDFPYFSPCGREKNYVRCNDLPIVFTHVHEVLEKNGETKDYLSYNHAGNLLLVNFEPNKLFMLPQTGRVYHPANEQYGGVGLVKSSLAIEFSKNIEFCDEESEEYGKPTHFTWKGFRYELSNEILKLLGEKQFSQLHY